MVRPLQGRIDAGAVAELAPVRIALIPLGLPVLVEQHVDLALFISERASVLDLGWIVAADTATAIRADKSALERAYLSPSTS